MADRLILPQSTEISIATANTVGAAVRVRLFNSNSAAKVVTLANSTANYASYTVTGLTESFVRKAATDTVQMTDGLAIKIHLSD